MILYPAIDLLDGRAVRLRQGRREDVTDFGDPVELARRWRAKGAQWLHLVDLEAAFEGKTRQLPLLERIVKDDILALYQPIFLDYDMHAVISRCGEELSSTSYAFGTMARLNAKVSYGTDCPVEDCNPFPNIYSAVTRKDKNGWPEGGFFPKECVDVYTAIDAYTAGSAYAQFMENEKGRIKPGFMADMVMLDKDIFTCDPMEIRDILPVMTIVGGEIVYER